MTSLLTHISIDVAASLCEAFRHNCILQAARLTERDYNSFDENFPGTTPRMSISRKIHFRDSNVTIGERTNALDRVESNVRNVLRPQPFQKRPPLKRDWQRAKLYDGEICMSSNHV